MALVHRCVVVLASASLTACGAGQDPRIPELEARIAALESKQKSLADDLTRTKFQQELEKLDGVAFLTPDQKGYAAVKFDLGYLTVSLEDIKPYANGSKVRLHIGNLTAARVNGLKAKIGWGSTDKAGIPNNASAKSREVALEESLRSGAWTSIELVLDGVPPAEFGFLRVSDVGHRGIGLSR